MWLTSQEFENIPRTSEQLPRREDGSVGSAFDCWHAGLRSYETVKTSATSASLAPSSSGDGSATPGGEGRRKWLVSVQTVSDEDETLEAVVDAYGREKGCRYWIMYRLVTGLLGYYEPSEPDLPRGMVLLEFDGEEPPRVQAKVQGLRTDVWSLVTERGDLSLEL